MVNRDGGFRDRIMTEIIIDIETIPDLEYGKEYMNLDGLADQDIIRAMTFRFLQQSGSEFPPLNMHKIIAISFLKVSSEKTTMKTLSIDEYTEEAMLRSLHEELENGVSRLISWNGLAFDVPVIHIRSMIYELVSSEVFISPSKHLDLKNEISFAQTDKILGLGTLSKQMGSTGKPLDSGKMVWDLYLEKAFSEIAEYCESDVINTYLIYLSYQVLSRIIDNKEKQSKLKELIEFIKNHNPSHMTLIKKS